MRESNGLGCIVAIVIVFVLGLAVVHEMSKPDNCLYTVTVTQNNDTVEACVQIKLDV